ncbi:chymotrypsin inhibitor [Nylanderia fulva]|uniref:chymotrypsin inhibitor n=1 Tax=Nylanderia fulva TaxID=613905 RepID=UPI0010FAEF57|nr:chymotrypsin inhibitor [Nylanderia fulva]
MSRISFVLLVVVGVILSITAAQNPIPCPENQVYKECGTACPPKCNEDPSQVMCTMQCVPGCFCKSGFLLNAENNCVQPAQC